jgi:hypothetical protein
MALKLDILANTSQFVKEMKKAGASTEDISDALDDMAKDGEKAGEKLESSFRDIAKASKRAGDDVGTSMDDGFNKAKRGADDFKDEAKSTAKEAAASFDGSAESIGDAFQEVAANALEGFGPLGAAAGVAIAAGLGTGMAALEKFNDALESSREAAFDFASDLEDRANIAAQIESWTTNIERFKQAQDIAYATGRDVADVISDLATGGDNLDDLQQAFEDMSWETDLTLGRVTELNGVLEGTKDGFDQGAAAAAAQEDAVKKLNDTAKSKGEETRKFLENAWKTPVTGTVKLQVDDSLVRYYADHPPTINLKGKIGVTQIVGQVI